MAIVRGVVFAVFVVCKESKIKGQDVMWVRSEKGVEKTRKGGENETGRNDGQKNEESGKRGRGRGKAQKRETACVRAGRSRRSTVSGKSKFAVADSASTSDPTTPGLQHVLS